MNYRYKDIFYDFFELIYKDYESLITKNNEFLLEPVFLENTQSPVIEQTKYISSGLTNLINYYVYYCFGNDYTFKNVNINVKIYEKSKVSKLFTQDRKKLMYIIFFMVYYCTNINPNHQIKQISIKIINSPYKKLIGTILTEHNINSGLTIINHSNQTAEIIVFRKEEKYKVLIHEFLHAFDIDTKIVGDETSINKMFGIQHSTVNINESFTESYACLLNTCICAKLLSKQTQLNARNLFIFLLDIERHYIIKQAYKVFKSLSLIIKNNKITSVQKRTECTHVTSYYILKAINFANIEQFIKYLNDNRYKIVDHKIYLQYILNMIKITKWDKDIEMLSLDQNTLETFVRNKKFKKFFDNTMKKLQNKKSLRMSSLDISTIN
jgi:hypothetical protein